MDWLTAKSLDTDNYRYGFLFQGAASALFVLALPSVYRQWQKLGAEKHVVPEV
jgi:hypothetical protein